MKTENERRLLALIQKKSYREGDFTLASGQKSKFYIDMKATTLDPEGAVLIGDLAVHVCKSAGLIGPGGIQAVGGLTLGADPIATAVSIASFHENLHWPAYIVRKESKGHGTGKYVEGTENMPANARCLVLEDVVTTGGSSIQAIERLRCEGFNPIAVLTVVDREQGGAEKFEAMGMKFLALVKISELRSNH